MCFVYIIVLYHGSIAVVCCILHSESQLHLHCCFHYQLNSAQVSVIHTFSLHTPGSWLRKGLLTQWSASAITRSPAESECGRTLRTAGGSTTRKWPEKLPLSPGQTERILGSAASKMGCDEKGRYQWTGQDGASQMEESVSRLNAPGKYGKKSCSCCHTVEQLRCIHCQVNYGHFFPFYQQHLAWKVQYSYSFLVVMNRLMSFCGLNLPTQYYWWKKLINVQHFLKILCWKMYSL